VAELWLAASCGDGGGRRAAAMGVADELHLRWPKIRLPRHLYEEYGGAVREPECGGARAEWRWAGGSAIGDFLGTSLGFGGALSLDTGTRLWSQKLLIHAR
jgi:hypothetical protein